MGGGATNFDGRVLEPPGMITMAVFVNPTRLSAEPIDDRTYFFPERVAGVVGFEWCCWGVSVIVTSLCIIFEIAKVRVFVG